MDLTKKNCMIAKNRMRGLAYTSCNCKEENIDEVNNCDNYLEQLINEHFNNPNQTDEFKHFKLHSDSTLKKLTKDELISYIHMVYHNWGATDEAYNNIMQHVKGGK